jgi:mannose-1-phosphate guanylyltransferase
MNLIPTILSGGSGSRLWPMSREEHPKPFIRLADGESLLQKAFLRGAALANVSEVLAVTNRDLFFKTRDDFTEVNHNQLDVTYILEPCARNTAAAIAAAVLNVIERHGKDAVMLVLAADHLIQNQRGFSEAVLKAQELAQTGKVVTFGIHPTEPATGYGYIQASGHEVIRFIEKPTHEKALEYVVSESFYWNAGIFCFQAGVMLKEMQTHCPEILIATQQCFTASNVMQGAHVLQLELEASSYALIPENSIDYAVMERSNKVAVVPCDIGWSDIGSWISFASLSSPDANQNRVEGEVLLDDTHDCIVHSENRLVATLGVSDLIIVDTPDALLVAEKSKAQEVKNIYTKLKHMQHDAYKAHRQVKRPWGSFSVLVDTKAFKVKRIFVNPGQRLSLQSHQFRAEHWVVVNGTANVINNNLNIILNPGESTFIEANHKHQLQNIGQSELEVIEVQTGTYFGEDDIERFSDHYGRI